MGIFNSNDYNRGHRDGKADALAYRDKNYNRAGKSFKFAFYGNSAYDSYCEGYNEGYRQGCKERK